MQVLSCVVCGGVPLVGLVSFAPLHVRYSGRAVLRCWGFVSLGPGFPVTLGLYPFGPPSMRARWLPFAFLGSFALLLFSAALWALGFPLTRLLFRRVVWAFWLVA